MWTTVSKERSVAVAWLRGAAAFTIVRVHDVRAAVRTCRMVEAIRDAEPGEEP